MCISDFQKDNNITFKIKTPFIKVNKKIELLLIGILNDKTI